MLSCLGNLSSYVCNPSLVFPIYFLQQLFEILLNADMHTKYVRLPVELEKWLKVLISQNETERYRKKDAGLRTFLQTLM